MPSILPLARKYCHARELETCRPDLPFARNRCTKIYDLCLVRARAAYCFGPMSIVQDPGCRNDGRAWSRFIGTVVEVLSRCVVLVRPCNKGSKLSRPHGIMVEVFLTDAETSWLDVECRYGTTMPWGPARAAPAVPGVMALCHQTVFPIPTQRFRIELMTCLRQILRFFAIGILSFISSAAALWHGWVISCG